MKFEKYEEKKPAEKKQSLLEKYRLAIEEIAELKRQVEILKTRLRSGTPHRD